jgi:hypothetical protein
LLVLIAALADRTNVVLAVESGHRVSSESWAQIRRDLTARGLPAPEQCRDVYRVSATSTAAKCPLLYSPRRPPPDAHLHTS